MNMKFLLQQLFAASAVVAVASSNTSLRGRRLQTGAPEIGDFDVVNAPDDEALPDAPSDGPSIDDAFTAPDNDGPDQNSVPVGDPLDAPTGPDPDAADGEGFADDLGNEGGPTDVDAPVEAGDDTIAGERPYANGDDPAASDDGTPQTGSTQQDESGGGPADPEDGSSQTPPDEDPDMAAEPDETGGPDDDAATFGGDDADASGPSTVDQSQEPTDDNFNDSADGYVPPPDSDFTDPEDGLLPGAQDPPSPTDGLSPPTPVGDAPIVPEETYSGPEETLADDDNLEGSDSGPGSFNVDSSDQVQNDSDPGAIGR